MQLAVCESYIFDLKTCESFEVCSLDPNYFLYIVMESGTQLSV